MKDYVKSDADVTIGKTEEKRQVISVNIDDIKKMTLKIFIYLLYAGNLYRKLWRWK